MHRAEKRLRIARRAVAAVTGLVAMLSMAILAHADDWPQWGGPERDLVWRETGIVKELPTKGRLPRMWSVPLGEGYSGPAVADGRVYITDRIARGNLERVLCIDAETGKELWSHQDEVIYTVSYPAGPRSTPVIDEDRVYTIGAMGDMFCFNADDGEVLWKKNFVKDFETQLPTWGMAASPLVDGRQLITLVGGADGALVVSLDKITGEEIWRSLDSPEVGYCPPLIFTFDGIRQLIIWHPTAVCSLNPENGEVYWEVPFPVKAGLCIPNPRQVGNRLFITSFYNGSMMLEIDGIKPRIVWKRASESEVRTTEGLHSIMPTPVFNETHIYGIGSYGQLRCLDAKTGDRIWETYAATGEGRWWNAFLVPHEDRFFIHNEQGDLIIANLTPQGYQELSRAELVKPTRKVQRRMTIWSQPAFAMQSVFARNDEELVRVNLAAER